MLWFDINCFFLPRTCLIKVESEALVSTSDFCPVLTKSTVSWEKVYCTCHKFHPLSRNRLSYSRSHYFHNLTHTLKSIKRSDPHKTRWTSYSSPFSFYATSPHALNKERSLFIVSKILEVNYCISRALIGRIEPLISR